MIQELFEFFILAILAGIGFWVFGLTLVYSIPVGAYIIFSYFRQKRKLMTLLLITGALGILIGSFPWWIYASQNGLNQLMGELFGGAIAGVENLSWLRQIGAHIIYFLLFGIPVIFGLRPSWDVTWLVLPLIPIILAFWLMVIIKIFRRTNDNDVLSQGLVLIKGVILTLILIFLLTPFGADPSGRYFLPLAVPLSIFAAGFINNLNSKMGRWSYSVVCLILAYNFMSTFQCIQRYPPGLTTQFYEPARVDQRYMGELITFLKEKGENRGYTNYWVTYPLAFQSNEELIFIPRLPYHTDFRYTERDDRYVPYDLIVEHADRVAYITTNHPALDSLIQSKLSQLGVIWEEHQIGDYHVFYNLSKVVCPQDIGLGVTVP